MPNVRGPVSGVVFSCHPAGSSERPRMMPSSGGVVSGAGAVYYADDPLGTGLLVPTTSGVPVFTSQGYQALWAITRGAPRVTSRIRASSRRWPSTISSVMPWIAIDSGGMGLPGSSSPS